MISVRTVTFHLPESRQEDAFAAIGNCIHSLAKLKYHLHTTRVALPLQCGATDWNYLDKVASFCRTEGIRWFNIPLDVWNKPCCMDGANVATILKRYDNAFCNLLYVRDGTIREDILELAADCIKNVSSITESGKDNFRFGASANVFPDGPFFPFTFSKGDVLSFSIGLELTKEINEIMDGNWRGDLNCLREMIVARLVPQFREIENFALWLSEECGIAYRGIDFSLAPLPEEKNSVITILEKLGVQDFNAVGMLFVTAFLTDLLKHFAKTFRSVGFSGVMYSLLEDAEYAAINDAMGVSIDKMISLSTMCGCGVDMVPVAKDTDPGVIRTILMEVGCVSSRLHKPLGVRILPVTPDCEGRTQIADDLDFIINTRIVATNANRLPGTGDVYRYFYCTE